MCPQLVCLGPRDALAWRQLGRRGGSEPRLNPPLPVGDSHAQTLEQPPPAACRCTSCPACTLRPLTAFRPWTLCLWRTGGCNYDSPAARPPPARKILRLLLIRTTCRLLQPLPPGHLCRSNEYEKVIQKAEQFIINRFVNKLPADFTPSPVVHIIKVCSTPLREGRVRLQFRL